MLARKCSFHKTADAVAECSRCGNPVCDDCMITMDNDAVICPSCFWETLKGQKKIYDRIDTILFVGTIFGAVFFGFAVLRFRVYAPVAFLAALWVATIPISIFMFSTKDPYLWASQGEPPAAIYDNLFYMLFLAPVIGFSALRGQFKRKKVIASNEEFMRRLKARVLKTGK